jgi:hypothetical protein
LENFFVFVVCGKREHIETLHYSLKALQKFSAIKALVVTDRSRNEIEIEHNWVLDVKTPAELNHHQASIFLKTSLHKHVPPGKNYCYLDTDVVAVDTQVHEVFSYFSAPITFANDHCLMDKFSPSAINCSCIQQYAEWANELRSLFAKYKHLTRQPENLEKKEKLLKEFEALKQNKIKNTLLSIKFMLSPRKFRLHEDAFLDKKRQAWFDKDGNAILYEKEDNAITAIETTTDYRCDKTNNHRWTIYGHDVFDCRCNHLQEQIVATFGLNITNPKWQHWNGGVFLFNEASHDFLNKWHEKTMHIFGLPEWKTRDQGTLIATAWEFGLQNHPVIPVEFNLIADYNHQTMKHNGNLSFDIDERQKNIQPHFVHVYHHWADKNWDVWQAVENRTGIVL